MFVVIPFANINSLAGLDEEETRETTLTLNDFDENDLNSSGVFKFEEDLILKREETNNTTQETLKHRNIAETSSKE